MIIRAKRNFAFGVLLMLIFCWSTFATQEAKLLPNDPIDSNHFGVSVAMHGNYLIVGCSEDDDAGNRSGSAYIFKWSVDQWVQEVKLTAPDALPGAQFGYSVSISGSYALVGAFRDHQDSNQEGAAYLWRLNGDSWEYVEKLRPTIPQADSEFGNFVKIYNDYALIGSHHYQNGGYSIGALYVFERNGTTFQQDALIYQPSSAQSAKFGTSAAMYGNTLLIGAPQDFTGDDRTGSVYVYEHDGVDWNFQQNLTHNYLDHNDSFGRSVDIWQGWALIGAPGDTGSAGGSGGAYLFRFHNDNWTMAYRLVPSAVQPDVSFGWSVAMNENYAVIGAPWYNDDTLSNVGMVYIYAYDGEFWTERMKLTASDSNLNAMLGYSVSVQNNEAIVGAFGADHDGYYPGAAYWFQDFYAPPPTPTPTPSAISYDIDLIDTVLAEGDIFQLNRACFNPLAAINVDEYILLEMYEHFWYWPGWSETVDSLNWNLNQGVEYDDIILTFSWPYVEGTAEGLRFWGAFLHAGTADLILYDMVEWGYSNK